MPEAIVQRAGETLDPLCEILLDKDPRNSEDESVWAPIHALHLLGAIGDMQAAPALIEAIRTDQREDWLGDWLTEDMGNILGSMPPEACGALKQVALDDTMDLFHRLEPADELFGIACRHEPQQVAKSERQQHQCCPQQYQRL